MSQLNPLDAEKNHLSGLLEAIQRCVYFLDASSQTLQWPMDGSHLARNKKDKELFEALAAINICDLRAGSTEHQTLKRRLQSRI
jgi:hypothetical protein